MHARKRIARIRDFLRSLCFLCPSFLGVCLFFVVPFAVVVKYALTNSADADAAFVGIENFRKLLTRDTAWSTTRR